MQLLRLVLAQLAARESHHVECSRCTRAPLHHHQPDTYDGVPVAGEHLRDAGTHGASPTTPMVLKSRAIRRIHHTGETRVCPLTSWVRPAAMLSPPSRSPRRRRPSLTVTPAPPWPSRWKLDPPPPARTTGRHRTKADAVGHDPCPGGGMRTRRNHTADVSAAGRRGSAPVIVLVGAADHDRVNDVRRTSGVEPPMVQRDALDQHDLTADRVHVEVARQPARAESRRS